MDFLVDVACGYRHEVGQTMLNTVVSCECFIFFLCECASISPKSQKLILELLLLHNMLNFTFYNSHIGDVNGLEFKWYCPILPIKRTNLSLPTYCKDKKNGKI